MLPRLLNFSLVEEGKTKDEGCEDLIIDDGLTKSEVTEVDTGLKTASF